MSTVLWLAAMAAGTAAIVWGAERFAEHLADAAGLAPREIVRVCSRSTAADEAQVGIVRTLTFHRHVAIMSALPCSGPDQNIGDPAAGSYARSARRIG